MSTRIVSIEDHRNGEFHVDVNLNGKRARFPSMMDAQKWMQLMKASGQIERLAVEL